jgi:NADPH-dependent 2,4-dienoyl-CoA reductase/sulfur reductase-like enzyme
MAPVWECSARVDRSLRLRQDLRTTAESAPDLAIVGGGIVGMTTACYLAKARVTDYA